MPLTYLERDNSGAWPHKCWSQYPVWNFAHRKQINEQPSLANWHFAIIWTPSSLDCAGVHLKPSSHESRISMMQTRIGSLGAIYVERRRYTREVGEKIGPTYLPWPPELSVRITVSLKPTNKRTTRLIDARVQRATTESPCPGCRGLDSISRDRAPIPSFQPALGFPNSGFHEEPLMLGKSATTNCNSNNNKTNFRRPRLDTQQQHETGPNDIRTHPLGIF